MLGKISLMFFNKLTSEGVTRLILDVEVLDGLVLPDVITWQNTRNTLIVYFFASLSVTYHIIHRSPPEMAEPSPLFFAITKMVINSKLHVVRHLVCSIDEAQRAVA